MTPKPHLKPDAPRHLSPTERLHEVTLAFANRAASPPEHSGGLKRNSRGVWEIDLTVRGYDLQKVIADLTAGADLLAKRYPFDSGGGNVT